MLLTASGGGCFFLFKETGWFSDGSLIKIFDQSQIFSKQLRLTTKICPIFSQYSNEVFAGEVDITPLQKAPSSRWGWMPFCQSRDVAFWKGASSSCRRGSTFIYLSPCLTGHAGTRRRYGISWTFVIKNSDPRFFNIDILTGLPSNLGLVGEDNISLHKSDCLWIIFWIHWIWALWGFSSMCQPVKERRRVYKSILLFRAAIKT